MAELTTKLDLSSLDPKPREVTTAPSDPTLWEADPFYEAAEALQVRAAAFAGVSCDWVALATGGGSERGSGDGLAYVAG